ncbi:MAG TPA: molybdate ABC transporter permease subunit [Tepidisphaeraceae bacterium]|jgi:molybdate transport system permease protein|nr:molybdate ABC transporter permease subunit [Tepidisphaeraceae bacterium]
MSDLGWAIFLSMRIALLATAAAALAALPLAFWLGRKKPFGASALEALILLPLVLPPTVVGYILIRLLGAQSWIGILLKRAFNYTLLFRIEAAVLAATVVSLPLLYLPAKAAFASVERELEEVARIMGANRLQILWYVSLPIARRGIISGLLLAFARALGEFGATVMVFGNSEDRLTLPISVYVDYEQNQWSHALPAVLFLTAVSLVVIVIYNRLPVTRQE